MKLIEGDIWEYYDRPDVDSWAVIPVNRGGVMGRGLARQYRDRFEETKIFPTRASGGLYHLYFKNRCVFFPVKNHWRLKADIQLIHHSCQRLLWNIFAFPEGPVFLLPLVGCGFGELNVKDVVPVLKFYFGHLDQVRLVVPPRSIQSKYPSSFRKGAKADYGIADEVRSWIKRQVKPVPLDKPWYE